MSTLAWWARCLLWDWSLFLIRLALRSSANEFLCGHWYSLGTVQTCLHTQFAVCELVVCGMATPIWGSVILHPLASSCEFLLLGDGWFTSTHCCEMWNIALLLLSHADSWVFPSVLMLFSSIWQTWLILPVVICLSQRLSHACLSISFYTAKLRMAH